MNSQIIVISALNHASTPLVQQFLSKPKESFQNLVRITIFKIVILFVGLDSLKTRTHDLTVRTKTKETAHYCKSFGYGGKGTLDKHFYHSNGVSVPAEEG
jgi:hypothetical protein